MANIQVSPSLYVIYSQGGCQNPRELLGGSWRQDEVNKLKLNLDKMGVPLAWRTTTCTLDCQPILHGGSTLLKEKVHSGGSFWTL